MVICSRARVEWHLSERDSILFVFLFNKQSSGPLRQLFLHGYEFYWGTLEKWLVDRNPHLDGVHQRVPNQNSYPHFLAAKWVVRLSRAHGPRQAPASTWTAPGPRCASAWPSKSWAVRMRRTSDTSSPRRRKQEMRGQVPQ